MLVEDGAEDIGEGLEAGAVHEGNGAGAEGAFLGVVVVVVLAAVGLQVGGVVGEDVPGEVGVAHAGGEDFGGRDNEAVGDGAEFPGDFDAAGEAGVEDEVFEVHGDGAGEFLEFDPAGGVAGGLVADGAGGGVFVVAGGDPAASVGGDDHAVAAGGEGGADVVEDAAEGFGGGADGHVVVAFQGVDDRFAVRSAVDAHQGWSVRRRIAAGGADVVAEGDDGLLAVQPGKHTVLKV